MWNLRSGTSRIYMSRAAALVLLLGWIGMVAFAAVRLEYAVGTLEEVRLAPDRSGAWTKIDELGTGQRPDVWIPAEDLGKAGRIIAVRGTLTRHGNRAVLIGEQAWAVPGWLMPWRGMGWVAGLPTVMLAFAGLLILIGQTFLLRLLGGGVGAYIAATGTWVLLTGGMGHVGDLSGVELILGTVLAAASGAVLTWRHDGLAWAMGIVMAGAAAWVATPSVARVLEWPISVAAALTMGLLVRGSRPVMIVIGGLLLALGVGATEPPMSYAVFAFAGWLITVEKNEIERSLGGRFVDRFRQGFSRITSGANTRKVDTGEFLFWGETEVQR